MKKIILSFYLALSYCICQAQEIPNPLVVSVFKESIKLPPGFNGPFHPGAQVRTEFYVRNRGKTVFVPTLNVSYYFHRKMYHNLSVGVGLGYRYRFTPLIHADVNVGVAYTFQLLNVDTYTAKDGEFTRKKTAGLHRLSPSLSVSTGYKLSREKPSSPTLFLRYEVRGDGPFNKEVPFLPHTIMHIGAIIPYHSPLQKP